MTPSTRTGYFNRNTALKWLALGVALCLCGAYAYFLMFSRFGFWDDEGYLMATVHAMLEGHLLYDQIYTLYGPFYYLFEGALYTVTGAAVTHDFTRFLGLFFWLASASFVAWSVLRITESFLLSALALFAVSKVLVFFSGEPGHPEELCIFCVTLLLAIALTIGPQIRVGQSAAVGILLAALTLTKINIGLYAIWAVLLAFLSAAPRLRIKRILFVLVTVGALACIGIIMSPLLHAWWVQNYFMLIVLSIVSAAMGVLHVRTETTITLKNWIVIAIAFAGASLITVLVFLLRGTTFSAMVYISVLQHKNFAREWFVAGSFSLRSSLWALLSLAVGVLWFLRRPASLQNYVQHSAFEATLQAFKGVIAAWSTLYLVVMHPDDLYGVHLLKILTPLSWLVLVPPANRKQSRDRFPHIFLCLLAIFVSLYPFPVASAQLLFALVPLIVVLGVFWYDAAVRLAGIFQLRQVKTRRLLETVALVLLALVYTSNLRAAYRQYAAMVPLALPGAGDIHVSPADAQAYHWVTAEIDRHCASLFSMPGLFSFNFWTGKETPTMMMMNDWPGFLNAHQQQVIVGDLARNHTACIIYYPQAIDLFLHGKPMPNSPLVQYIHTHFRETVERDGYHLLMRKDDISAGAR